MLTFAAIVPHPPLILPTIGKEQQKKLKKTMDAFAAVEQDLYVSHPDVIVVISPHGDILPDAFSINLAAEYTVGFKEFGDFQTTKKFGSEFMLIDHIQRNARKETPLVVSSKEEIDYGAGIPLLLLTEHLPKVNIVPVSSSGLDIKTHYEFGKLLKDDIFNSNKRIAVIASADLAHTLKADGPAGYTKEGAELDAAIQELLMTRNTTGLLGLDAEMCAKAQECGVRPIALLLGILFGVRYEPKMYTYEAPFGVGYLVSTFVLS